MSTGLFLSAAIESVGGYPAATLLPTGETKPRTDWQEGWNACLLAIFENQKLLDRWFIERCSPWTTFDAIRNMLTQTDRDLLMFKVCPGKQKPVTMYANVNDLFCYGSDVEEITDDELNVFCEAYQYYNYYGIVAYVSLKRNQDPHDPYIANHDIVKAAKLFLISKHDFHK